MIYFVGFKTGVLEDYPLILLKELRKHIRVFWIYPVIIPTLNEQDNIKMLLKGPLKHKKH